jgi:hypothetical protein
MASTIKIMNFDDLAPEQREFAERCGRLRMPKVTERDMATAKLALHVYVEHQDVGFAAIAQAYAIVNEWVDQQLVIQERPQ